VPTQRPTQ